MDYVVGQVVKTFYGNNEIVKVNKESVLVSTGSGSKMKVMKKHLNIMNGG